MKSKMPLQFLLFRKKYFKNLGIFRITKKIWKFPRNLMIFGIEILDFIDRLLFRSKNLESFSVCWLKILKLFKALIFKYEKLSMEKSS